MNRIRGFLVIWLSLITITLHSQNQIEYRSDFGKIYPENPNDIVLVDNVVFTHKDMTMYCDSAIYNQKENYFDAFNNIKMYQGDSVSLFGDVLHYDGNTKIGELDGRQVVMRDNDVTMHTDYLIVDRNLNTVSYYSSATIFNSKDTLRSKEGVYFIDDEVFRFYHSVRLNSKDGKLIADSLFYNTKTEESEFYGNSAVLVVYDDTTRTDSSFVISPYGKYNSKTEEIYSDARPEIYTKNTFITADTLYYDKKRKNGYAYNNIYVADTVEKIWLNCNAVRLNTEDTLSIAFITDSLLVRQTEKEDTLYFHADTLRIVMDTSFEVKELFAYAHCKFYRNDMQGACEYAYYNRSDSSLLMLKRPVLWAEESQMTADTILLITDEKNVKELYMRPNTFIVQNSDTNTNDFFNQISGKNLTGYFERNKIYYAEIDGNTRSVYYIWDENKKQKTKKLTGVNIGLSKAMHLYFKGGELKKMVAVKDPEFYMDALKNISDEERQLRGFIYLESDRPKQPVDIYINRFVGI
ncbi:MAG: hypothetical protein IJ681_09715 [Bacteroidales bacterium]|nr:hypothetical protein [Bacteroidales bacterium]